MDARRALRILAPTDFQTEVLPPMVVSSGNPVDVARCFAQHIENSLYGLVSPPKFTLVDVQILRARTFSDKLAQYEPGNDYLTVGIEGNSSLTRAIGVIRFSVAGNILSGTLQTREAFAAGRSIGNGLANWLFPEPDPNNRDENGQPKQGCGSFFGMVAAGGLGYALIGTWAGPGPGIIGAAIAFVLAYFAVSSTRQQKERHEEELLTIIRLQLVSAYSNFTYSPQKRPASSNRSLSRHERYAGLSQDPGAVKQDHAWTRD
jgi:hypothetical protein